MIIAVVCLVLAIASLAAPFFVKAMPRKVRVAGPLIAAGVFVLWAFDGFSPLGTSLLAAGTYLGIQTWKSWQAQLVIDRGEAAVARMSAPSQE